MHPGNAEVTSTPGYSEFAAEFSEFACALDGKALGPDVAEAARCNLLDTLACATAGRTAPGVAELAELVTLWGGAEQSLIWGSRTRVPAHHAAWVNGTMAHARDYDDTHDAAVLHAGVSVIPAALAAADLSPDADGNDLLAGIAVGLELVCRLGVATTVGIIESGFIYSSLFGYFGAAAAAARVAGLDAAGMQNAIGIAYSQAAGTHQVTRDAATTKRMQPGLAAQAGVLAVQLAQRGIRGAQNVFDGVDGLFRTYLRSGYDPRRLRADLGRKWDFADLSYKPYPCCRFVHTAIDASLAVAGEPGFDPAQVTRVTAGVSRQAFEAVCTPEAIRKRPKTIVQAQFSIPFAVAAALIDGKVGLQHFTPEGLQREDILALSARVDCHVDDEIEREWGRSVSPTALEVLSGNQTISRRAVVPSGHPKAPMSAEARRAKLVDCLAMGGPGWPDNAADRLNDLVASVGTMPEARKMGLAMELAA